MSIDILIPEVGWVYKFEAPGTLNYYYCSTYVADNNVYHFLPCSATNTREEVDAYQANVVYRVGHPSLEGAKKHNYLGSKWEGVYNIHN